MPYTTGTRFLASFGYSMWSVRMNMALRLQRQAALVFGDAMTRTSAGELRVRQSWTQPEGPMGGSSRGTLAYGHSAGAEPARVAAQSVAHGFTQSSGE